MRYSSYPLMFLSIMLLLSCRNEKKEPATEGPVTERTDTPAGSKGFDMEAVIKSLEGKWREPEYPFRLAEFQDSLVKFTEEGVVEAPEFRKFLISDQCPFRVNNIRNLKPEDIILIIPEAGTCEKLQVTKDSIVLSGFSVTTGREYRIVYRKLE